MLRCNVDSKGKLIFMTYQEEYIETNQETGVKSIQTRKANFPPLINEIGLKDIKSIMGTYLSKNMYLSEFDKFEIADMVKETMINVAGILYMNYMEYVIEVRNLSMIGDIVIKYINNLDSAQILNAINFPL